MSIPYLFHVDLWIDPGLGPKMVPGDAVPSWVNSIPGREATSLVMKMTMVMTMCPLRKPKPRIGLRRERQRWRQRQRASPAKEAGRRMWRNTRSSIPLSRRSQFLAWTTKQQFFLYSSTHLKKLDFQSSLSTQIIMPNTLFIFNIYVVWFGLCIFLPPLLCLRLTCQSLTN